MIFRNDSLAAVLTPDLAIPSFSARDSENNREMLQNMKFKAEIQNFPVPGNVIANRSFHRGENSRFDRSTAAENLSDKLPTSERSFCKNRKQIYRRR